MWKRELAGLIYLRIFLTMQYNTLWEIGISDLKYDLLFYDMKYNLLKTTVCSLL